MEVAPAVPSCNNDTTTTQPRANTRRVDMLSVLVAIYAALLPFQFEVARMINLAPSDCILPLILLLAPGQMKYRKPAWTIWHLGLVLVFAISSFVYALRSGELNRYELVNKDVGLLLLFLSYAAITSTVFEWQDLRRILRVFTLSVVSQNVVAVAAFLAGYFWGISTPLVDYRGSRLAGMLLDPNAYGGLLVLTLVMCEGASWGTAPLFKGLPLFVSRLTLGLGILFTFSRSAWIALGLAFVVLSAVRKQAAVRFAVVGLLAAPCLFVLMGSGFLNFFERMASRPKQVQGRFDIIHDALAAFAQHPLLGGGLGSFRVHEGTLVHNTAFWFLADFGLVGLVVLLAFLGWFFSKAWFSYRFAPDPEKPLVLALLLGHTAMLGLAMGIEAFYQRHWWLVLALIASTHSIVRRELLQPRRNIAAGLEAAADHTALLRARDGFRFRGPAKIIRQPAQVTGEGQWGTGQ
jgi:O-antigen ligase